jgi:hypothetical protein
MKNISDFNSFVQTINEAAPWDPKKAQTAIDELVKKNKDTEPTGLSFANVQKVYGKNDYSTRFKIAQALFLTGKSIFPRYDFNDASLNDKIYATSYTGRKNENLKMDKISEALLKAVKPIVDDFEKDVAGYFDQKISSAKPTVRQAKVAADKITG